MKKSKILIIATLLLIAPYLAFSSPIDGQVHTSDNWDYNNYWWGMDWSWDGDYFAHTGADEASMTILETGSWNQVGEFNSQIGSSRATGVSFHPNSEYIAYGESDGTVHIREYGSWNHLESFDAVSSLEGQSIEFSKQGDRLAVVDSSDQIHLFETGTWNLIDSWSASQAEYGIRWSVDDTYLIGGGSAGCTVSNPDQGEELISVEDDAYAAADMTTDFQYLSCGSSSGEYRIHENQGDWTSADQIQVLPGDGSYGYGTQFSPDDQYVAGGSRSGIYFYDTSSWDEVEHISRSGRDYPVEWDPHGRYFAFESGGSNTVEIHSTTGIDEASWLERIILEDLSPSDGEEVSQNPELVTYYDQSEGDNADITFSVSSQSETFSSISSESTVDWTVDNSLERGTTYEWCVEANDGSRTREECEDLIVEALEPNNPTNEMDSLNNYFRTQEDTGVFLEAGITHDQDVDDADVTFYVEGDGGWDNIGTDENVDFGGNAEMEWERNGKDGMYGFEPGETYEWYVEVDDGEESTNNAGNPFEFTVMDEDDLIGQADPDPTDGESGETFDITLEDNLMEGVDSELQFRYIDGGVINDHGGLQTVSEGEGDASVDISDLELEFDDTGEWFIQVDNGNIEFDFQDYEEFNYEFEDRTAELNIQTGDSDNLNPGSADFGNSNLEISLDNDGDGELDKAEFSINGNVFEVFEPVPEGETVQADITQEVSSEDEVFDWGVRLVDGGDVVEEELGLEFSTHVVDASWTDTSSAGVPAEFNIYYANEDGVFDFGSQDYEKLGTTRDTEISLAPEDLGQGVDDCFRVTAENSGGESSESSPPISEDGVCVGGEIN